MLRAILLFLIALVGCAADPYVDPAGSWHMTLTWGPGSCGFGGSSPLHTTVVKVGDRYAITESGAQLSGQIVCSPDWCRMSFTESGPGAPGSGISNMTISVDLTVDASDAIAGSGLAQVSHFSGGACSQVFSALGTLGP